MNRLTAALATLAIITAWASLASANDTSTGLRTILQLQAWHGERGGAKTAAIVLDGAAVTPIDGCSGRTLKFEVDSASESTKYLKSVLLMAFVSGKKVSFTLDSSRCLKGKPTFTGVTVER